MSARTATNAALIAFMFSSVSAAHSQGYPDRPIRIIIGGVGGPADFTARLVAQGVGASFKHPVIVDNRPSGVIPGQVVSQAQPDGYTLLQAGTPFWIGPLLEKMPYDPLTDFLPISLLIMQPNALVVHPSLPVKSVKELIALAKAKPGSLNYASASTGSSTHLSAELFKAMAGVNIVRVVYKAQSAQISDLVAGEVQLAFNTSTATTSFVKAGKLKVLAVTSSRPSALFPGVPTIAASGLPGYESAAQSGLFAPARTPDAIIKQLNQEIVRVLNTAEVKEKLFNAGIEPVGSSPAEFAAFIKADATKWAKVIKDMNIRAD